MKSKKLENKIKSKLKKNKKWNQYKKCVSNKNMRFIFSKVSFIFNEANSDANLLINYENNLVENYDKKEYWIKSIEEISSSFEEHLKSIDWKSFGAFLFYTYHQSEWFNKKSILKNVYNKENILEINEIKSKLYNQWITSLYDQKIKNFNSYIIKVLEILD